MHNCVKPRPRPFLSPTAGGHNLLESRGMSGEDGKKPGAAQGRQPPVLMVVYLIILAWAVLAWIRP